MNGSLDPANKPKALPCRAVIFPDSLFLIVAFTTIVWLLVTFVTKPENEETLKNFFRRIHPGGWWKRIATQVPEVEQDRGYAKLLVDWVAGVVLVYSILFGTGKLLFGDFSIAALFFVIAFSAAAILYRHLSRTGWDKLVE
jgi:SSS family solute:Na+ symporter